MDGWSERNHLLLNMTKMREILIDFWKKRTAAHPLSILP